MSKRRKVIKEITSWVLVVAVAVAAALIIRSFVIVNAHVPSGSMLNTIEIDSRIVAFRLSYLFREPERFDVIVFRYPLDEEKLYVKRIIGLPGETVEILGGVVYVYTDTRGEPLDEPHISNPRVENFGPVTVPEGAFFVLGDNRGNSEDSRLWARHNLAVGQTVNEEYAFVRTGAILGRVLFKYFPSIRTIR